MPIIGKLLKQTTAITYKRNTKKRQDIGNQLESLFKLLSKAKKTNFGSTHNFPFILEQDEIIKAYQHEVPITDYENFHKNWLSESINGTKDHTWPGRIRYYALSSGTTGSPSKRVPVTNHMIRSFQKSSLKQLLTLHELNLSDEFYGGQLLAVGGSSNLLIKDKHIEGDLSGILKKHTSVVVSPLTKPGNKITFESDWNLKLEMMVEKAKDWNISIIAGVPSWCILLMERIVESYQVKTIHDIWPNLEVYVHGGVFMDPYVTRLNKVLSRKIILLDTYLSSEGYFAYQKSPKKKGMQLLMNAGVFFEFIPFNSDYFDETGSLKDNYNAFLIDEVENNVDYALVVSTNAGLWRYLIGDLIMFIDIESREIKITGRINQFLSLCGEHLALGNINQAISQTVDELGLEISEFTIYANKEEFSHHWYIGTNDSVDSNFLMDKINHKLCELNDDYKSARKINLKSPSCTLLPVEKFYEFMGLNGKLGSQHKFPRVLNDEQGVLWRKFLSN